MIGHSSAALRSLASLYPLALVAVLWETLARSGVVPPIFLPAFSQVAVYLGRDLLSGDIFGPLLVSTYRAMAGFVLAMVIGVALGFAMVRVSWLDSILQPAVTLGFPAPKIAFLPIFILWFGIDHASKISLVALNCVFPFIVAAHGSAKSVPRVQIWAAQALATTGLGMFHRVVLPASLPSLMSGVRVAIPYALVTTFAAEMIAGGGGLGGELVYAQRFFETTRVFEYLLVMLAMGYLADVLFLKLRGRLLRWHD